MSFESQVSELTFETDGVTTAFGLANESGALFFMDGSDIRAATVAADGTVAELQNGTDFTVTGDGRTGSGSLNVALPPADGGMLRIWCETPIVQPERYEENDGFPAATHERAQDRGTMIARDLARRIARAISTPDDEGAPARLPARLQRAHKLSAFDAGGDPIATTFTAGEVEAALQGAGLGLLPDGTLGALSSTATLMGLFGAEVNLANGTAFLTAGRDAPGDGGGAIFYYDGSDSATADNGGTVRVDLLGRRFKAHARPIVPAEMFGLAVENTAEENDNALSAAIAWVSGLTNGGTVSIGNKTYNFNTAMVSTSKVRIIGLGENAELHSVNQTRAGGLNFRGASNAAKISHCGVWGLKVTGTTSWDNGAVEQGYVTGPGISFQYVDYFAAEQNSVSGFSDAGIEGIDCSYSRINFNRIDATAQGAQFFAIDGDQLGNQVVGNTITNTGLFYGIDIEGHSAGTERNYGTVVANNWVEQSWGLGIGITLSPRSVVSGNAVRASGQGKLQTPDPIDANQWHGISLFGSPNSSVTGNNSTSNAGYGFEIAAASNFVTLSGNMSTASLGGSLLVTDRSGTAAVTNLSMGANSWGEGAPALSGNVDFLTRSAGITFMNVASSDDKTLDWFEIGTFTPAVVGSGDAGTADYAVQQGKFTRIGNRVFFEIALQWSGHTGTGNISISGLPYTSANGQDYPAASEKSGLPITDGNILDASVHGNSKIINFSQWTPATGAQASVPIAAAVTELSISGHYPVQGG